MKTLLTLAMTPTVVAALALPALAAPTPVASKEFKDVKKANWGVVLPAPSDLLLDVENPDVLFDGIEQRAQPVKTEPKTAKKVEKKAQN